MLSKDIERLLDKLEKCFDIQNLDFIHKSMILLDSISREKALKKSIQKRIEILNKKYEAFVIHERTGIDINKCYGFLMSHK